MTSPRTATAEWKPQYQVTIVFATEDGRNSIIPSLCSIRGAAPNASVLNLQGYTPIWLDDVNWTLLMVNWEGSNVTPDTPHSYSPDSSATWEILCKAQEVSFTEAFEDASGHGLWGDHLRFELLTPNGTLLKDLFPDIYIIQKGQLQVRNVSWQGVDVTRSYSTFSPGVDMPRIRCSVHNLEVRTRDVLGLPVNARVTARLADGSAEMASGETGLTGALSLTQLPKGTYVVEASALGGRDTGNTVLSQDTQVNLRAGLGIPSIIVFLVTAMVLGAAVRRLRRSLP
jgi:hypothetical protein